MSIKDALESLYTGECVVYVMEDVTQDGITTQTKKVLFTGKCRLSYNKKYGSLHESVQTDTFARSEQTIRLFLANDVVVPEGSRITVTQNGVTGEYMSSSKAAVYSSHQEVVLTAVHKYS
ncbi:MAG: hypothetical protein IKS17_10165 [Firmicutes bacterium]|nr:hypothetical protein [Bacillota bacterium]